MKEIATVGFDYESVEKDVKQKLLALAGQFNRAVAAHHKTWLNLGEPISEAHELLAGNGREGKFTKWVESELSVTKRTAYRYKYAWDRFGNKCDSLSHFSTEAIYALSGPTVPEDAVKDAIKLAGKGKRVNLELAEELIEKHTVDSTAQESEPSGTATTTQTSSQSSQPQNGASTSTATDSANDSDGPLEDEPEVELTFEEKVKEANGRIESFCRQLGAFYKDNCPNLLSIDHMGRYDSAEAQIKAACSTLRTCKYHEQPCPKCKGDGCSKCEKESDFGAVTVLTYRQLAG